MKLLKRCCPFCNASEYDIILNLQAGDFASFNPTYDITQISQMGFAAEQTFPIVKCQGCGFIYALHVLSESLLQHVYSTVISVEKAKAYRKESVWAWGKLPRLSYLFSLATKQSDAEVKFLDYGCGWGETLQIGRACGIQCFGVEIEPQRIQFLRDQGFTVTETLDSLANKAPFDIVYSNTVLEHVPNPREVLKHLAAVTKVGGYGFFGVPAYSERRIQNICKNYYKGKGLQDKNINPWEHLNYFSPQNFRLMLHECGFKVIATLSSLEYFALPIHFSKACKSITNTLKEISLDILWYRTQRNRLIVQRL